MQFTCQATIQFADVPKEEVSAASTFTSMVQQLSNGMGVAIGAIALRIAAVWTGHPQSIPTMSDFTIAFGLLAVIALVGVGDAFQLPKYAGAHVSGKTA